MTIIIKYSLFAVIATLANIGSQDIAIRLYFGTYSVSLSILVGTAVGLVVKYILDKKYIFRAQIENISHDVRIFFLYTIMGVLTTIVFWGFEFDFCIGCVSSF